MNTKSGMILFILDSFLPKDDFGERDINGGMFIMCFSFLIVGIFTGVMYAK
jgi:hypothetical protein